MLKTLMKNSITDLRFVFRKLLLFEFVYMLLTSLLFIPVIAFLFNRVLRALGTPILLNNDIYQIGLSINGILWMLLIALCCGLLLFVQFGVILIVAQKHIFRQSVYMTDALTTTLRAFPKLLGIGLVQVMLLLLFLIPFIQTPVTHLIMRHFNIPIILVMTYHRSMPALFLYVLALVVVIYFILRWMFTLHFILLEGKSTREAVKASLRLTRRKKVRILVQWLVLNSVIYLFGFVLLSALGRLLSLFKVAWLMYVVHHLYLPFSSFLMFLISFVVIPINVIFVTRLFYKLQSAQGWKREDRLVIRPVRWLRWLEKKATGYFRQRKKRYLLLLCATIYACGTLFLSYSFHDNLVYLKWNVQIAAHRGDARLAPENSLGAIRLSLEQGVDAVEIDVQMSKDGIVVLNHDYSLNRVAGEPASVHELDYREIAMLEIGRTYMNEYRGEWIPTLEEVLATVKGKAKLIIEIKPYGNKKALTTQVVSLIEAHDMVRDCFIQSFDYNVLRTARELNEEVKLGQILFFAAGSLSTLDVDFYTVKQSMLSKDLVRRAHAEGREVWVWTVNQRPNMEAVLKYDIDGIITDYPEILQNMMGVRWTAANKEPLPTSS